MRVSEIVKGGVYQVRRTSGRRFCFAVVGIEDRRRYGEDVNVWLDQPSPEARDDLSMSIMKLTTFARQVEFRVR